jgi:Ca2+-binding EF-hand superfamily protein
LKYEWPAHCFVGDIGAVDVRELKAAMRALGFELKKEEVKKLLLGQQSQSQPFTVTIYLYDYTSML